MRYITGIMMTAFVLMLMTTTAVTSEEASDGGDIHEVEAKAFTDISWMGDREKKILENFITYYKLVLQTTANVLNPKAYNLDIVLPAVSGVIRLYTGPLLALAIILFLYFTINTFVDGIFTNPNFGRSASHSFTPTLDALTYVVLNAINEY